MAPASKFFANYLNSFGVFLKIWQCAICKSMATLGGKVHHYRDNAGLECDAVIHLEDGRWGAVEIKLGGDYLIEVGAQSLKMLRGKLQAKSEEQAPAFLMVLTAVGGLYQREDGMLVVPINVLKC